MTGMCYDILRGTYFVTEPFELMEEIGMTKTEDDGTVVIESPSKTIEEIYNCGYLPNIEHISWIWHHFRDVVPERITLRHSWGEEIWYFDIELPDEAEW